MVDSVRHREETLGEFLASRARGASDARLAGDAIAAVLTAVVIGVSKGPLSDIRLSIAACLLAFAIWGVADRELMQEHLASGRKFLLLRATRVIAATLGFAAAAFLMMALLGRALGRMIS